MFKYVSFALFIGFSMLLSGCGEAPPTLANVTGTVKFNGKPAEKLQVTFHSSGGKISYGTTDANGKYILAYNGNKTGVPLGTARVEIITALESSPPIGFVEPIPKKYNVETELTKEVKAGDNVADFELTK